MHFTHIPKVTVDIRTARGVLQWESAIFFKCRTYVVSIVGTLTFASFSVFVSIYCEIMELYIRKGYIISIYPPYDGIKAQSWREECDWDNSQNGNNVRSVL